MKSSEQIPPKLKFRVELNWKLALFTLLFLPLLVGLGLWQLERAEEKRTIQESWQRQQALPPVAFAESNASGGQTYRRVTVSGRFLPDHYFLLENQIKNGRPGYEVVMPFALAELDGIILVNRGWLPASPYRKELPVVETPEGELALTGMLMSPGLNRLIEGDRTVEQWPHRLLQLDPSLMAALLEQVGLPGTASKALASEKVLHLDADSVGALSVDWQPINMAPTKHLGYAVQWFTMALALAVLSLFANTNLARLIKARRDRRSQNPNKSEPDSR